jgi:hypothetical protein
MAEQEKFEFEKEDDVPEIEIVDDTPEQDRGRKPLNVEDPTEDEIAEYSEKVQKRLKELTHARHDERREKERALREHQEAIAYAKAVADENRKLQERLAHGEKYLMETTKARAEAELSQIEREYKDAYDAGDTDRIIAAQKRLSEIVVQKREIDNYVPTPLQETKTPVETQIPRIVPDERTRQWASQNQWFETDPVMRGAAFGIHDELVRRGYAAGSDAYFEQIDARIREEFPHKFESKRPANVVAPASRSASSTKKISLKQSEINVAKRLGIPLEQYAANKAKLMEQNNG